MTLSVLVALVPLAWVLITVISKGMTALLSSTWFTHSFSGLTASSMGGGIYHALIGTLMQGLVCAVISIPLGVFVAIYLVEYAGGSKLARITTFMVDILSGVPSIVAALFIYALWIATFGFPKSAFAVSLALVLLMVPVVVRNTEEMLRIVPQDLREASYALGVPKWKTIARIVLPTALPGIITGIMLALARVMGETAPLLILVGYAPFINFNLFGGGDGFTARRHGRRDEQPPHRGRIDAHLGCSPDPHPGHRGPEHRRQAHRPLLAGRHREVAVMHSLDIDTPVGSR